MLSTKKLLYKTLTLLSSIKTNRGKIPISRVNVALANPAIMQWAAGGIELYRLDETYYIMFVSLAIKYTGARPADMAAWKGQIDGIDLQVDYPYFITQTVDGQSGSANSYCTSGETYPYFKNTNAATANQVFRWTGAVLVHTP